MNDFTCMHRSVVEEDEIVCVDCGFVLSPMTHFYETYSGQKFTEFDDFMHPVLQEEPVGYIEICGKKIFDKSSSNKASKGKMYYDTLKVTRIFNPGQTDYYYHDVLNEAMLIMPFLNTHDITDDKYLKTLCLALCKTYLKYAQTDAQKSKILQKCSEYTKYSLSKINALLGSVFR